MIMRIRRTTVISALTIVTLAVTGIVTRATDWPIWGHSPSRNMVSDEIGLPDSFDPGKYKPGTEEIDLATTKNVRWVAKLGSGPE